VGKDKSGGGGVSQDSIERRAAALAALKLVCESSVLAPHLEALLAGLDAQVRHPILFYSILLNVTYTFLYKFLAG
jgi:hypothetical protein